MDISIRLNPKFLTKKVFSQQSPPQILGLTLSGVPQVGQTLAPVYSVDDPLLTATVAFQWLRDGEPIQGALMQNYVSTLSDVGAHIACFVSVSNAEGTDEAISPNLQIVHMAPTLTGGLADQKYTLGTGGQTIAAGPSFSGADLSFSVNGGDAVTDSETGIIHIPTDIEVTDEVVTVTVTNSGGQAQLSFLLNVEPEISASPTTTLTLNSSQLSQDISSLPMVLDPDGIWMSWVGYYDGTVFGDSNDFVIGLRAATGGGYIAATAGNLRKRNTASSAVRETAMLPAPDEAGWYMHLARVQESAAGGVVELTYLRSDQSTPITAPSQLSSTNISAINTIDIGGLEGVTGTSFRGRIFDLCIGRGDPAIFYAATKDGAFASDYDFSEDLNATLLHHWPLYRIDVGSPFSTSSFTGNEAEVTDSAGTLNSWSVGTAPTWGDMAPFGAPPFPSLDEEPTLNESGGAFTMTLGAASGMPAPATEWTFLWNGVDKTSEVVDGEWTRSGDGQGVLYAKYHNSLGAIYRVLDVLVNSVSPSGEDSAPTIEMAGVAHDGCYWQFDTTYPVGRFITGGSGGSPFVLGTPSVTIHYPSPEVVAGRSVNGSMLNVRIEKGPDSGFDSIHTTNSTNYLTVANQSDKYPLVLAHGDALFIGRSNMESQKAKNSLFGFSVLTCLSVVPKWDSFRPSYIGTDNNAAKPIYHRSDLQTLPSLDSTGLTVPDLSDNLSLLQRVHLDIGASWNRDWTQSPNHAGVYGRDLVKDYQDVMAYICSDASEEVKTPYVEALIQMGIDKDVGYREYLERKGEVCWQMDGGHNLGRKALIVFAGYMVNDPAMRDVVSVTNPNDKEMAFQEDGMTLYVTQEMADEAIAANYELTWFPQYRHNGYSEYEDGMVAGTGRFGMPEWRGSVTYGTWNADFDAHPYRTSSNHQFQDGTVFLMRACGLVDAWGHAAFFDYHERHMALETGGIDPWISQGGSPEGPFYAQVGGVPSVNAKFDGNFDYEMRTRHFPFSVVAPWAE